MAARTGAPKYRLELKAVSNSRLYGKVEIDVLDAEDTRVLTHEADLRSIEKRRKAARELAGRLKDTTADELLPLLEEGWNAFIDKHRRLNRQREAGSPEAAPEFACELLDAQPEAICRPLGLVGGVAYAAAWCQAKVTTTQGLDAAGHVVKHDPPLVQVQDCLVIVRDDGVAFADGAPFPGARPLAGLGLDVRLPHRPAPGRDWSGAGVKRYLAGERPDPAEVFRLLTDVVNTFIDFARSLAGQETMCELVAAYVLATYVLDAVNVVGYLWPNGEAGSGKTSLLQVVTEAAYLGQLILAGSSYPTLRDMADYGATLAFDDAEGVMDPRRTDPDKRTLLLAGNRRGATVAVKEPEGDRWVTRYVNTFCPRLFSAIRLPDPVLGSRTIVVPLVRSGDEGRTKANVMDPAHWPCDRRRLVDDLWALGLAHLPVLPEHDRAAAAKARLAGRALEPWRAVLAVAHWLEHRHGMAGLFDRLEELSMAYQKERGDYEEHDGTRVLFRALLEMTDGIKERNVKPADIAGVMNRIAREEDLAEADKDFTNARRVGWLMKRQRFKRGERKEDAKQWKLKRAEVEAVAAAFGVKLEEEKSATSEEEDEATF
jgi:hypothetical protein